MRISDKISAVILIISAIFILSCGKEAPETKPAEPSEAEPSAAGTSVSEIKAQQTDNEYAVITFMTGEVQVYSSSGWKKAEIGDRIAVTDKIKVETDSFCEIQFGTRAVIRVEENTGIDMTQLELKNNKVMIKINLLKGSILCKVEKLLHDERFKVSTKTTLCGVRGTEFRVTALEDSESGILKTTVLTVNEGAVSVLPKQLDVDDLSIIAGDKIDKIVSTLKQIEAEAPVVAAGHELTIAAEPLVKQTQEFDSFKESVKNLNDEGLTELQKFTDTIISAVAEPSEQIKPISAENKARFEDVKPINIEQDETLFSVNVNVIPPEASLFLDSELIGIGNFSGLFTEGSKLKIDANLNGYTSEHHEITVTIDQAEDYIIQLKKEPALPESSKPEVEEKTSGPEKTDVRISEERITGSIAADSGLLFASDSEGTLTAVSPAGEVIWQTATENTGAENSFPTAENGLVCYSGPAEYLLAAGSTGRIISRKPLGQNAAHIFGRRLINSEAGILLPSNSSITILDPENGAELNNIRLPSEGSQMTPAYYNGMLLSADPQGTFHIIDAENGEVLKSIKTGAAQPIALSIAVKNGLAVFSGRKGIVACIDLSAEKLLWEYSLPGSNQVFSDAVFSDSAVHVFSNNKIFSLSVVDGSEIFDVIEKASAPPAVYGNTIVFGSTSGDLIFAEASTGNEERRISANALITTRPAVSGDLIAAGTEDGRILIFNP